MKKKVFKVFGALAIAAILALNVSVVMDSSSSVLKWDLVGKILAFDPGSSGAGSSGEVDAEGAKERGNPSTSDCSNGCTWINPEGKEEAMKVTTCPGFLGPKDCTPAPCTKC